MFVVAVYSASGPCEMSLNWEATYEIALHLRARHPDADLGEVTLGDIREWVLALPDFSDDPRLCNDEILESICREWFEVTIND